MASNNRNPNPNQIQWGGLNGQPATFNSTRLDILAEVASQQPYLPPPEEYPAPGLILLARAASLRLGEDSNSSAATTTGPAATTNNNNTNRGGEDAEDGNNEYMEKTIVARPLKKKQPNPKRPSTTSFFSERPLLPRSSNRKQAANKPSPRPTATKATPASPATSDMIVDNTTTTTTSTTNDEPASTERKCTACAKVSKGKCQVVRRGQYFGACLRCVARGEMKRCSLYEG